MLIVSLVCISAASTSKAISKADRKMNVLEFQLGGSQPVGERNRIGSGDYEIVFVGLDELPFDLDASDIYKPAFYFSLNYGNLVKGQFYYNVGFHYVNLRHEDSLETDGYIYFNLDEINMNVYALDINFNYYLFNPNFSTLTPYIGLGLQSGIMSSSAEGYSNSNDLVYSMGVNIGVDFKIWEEQNGRSYLTIASANQYQFAASDKRPRYFQIGGAIKYFFRY